MASPRWWTHRSCRRRLEAHRRPHDRSEHGRGLRVERRWSTPTIPTHTANGNVQDHARNPVEVKDALPTIIIIALLIAVLMLTRDCGRERVDVRTRVDTVTKVIVHEPITITARATRVRDTVWLGRVDTSITGVVDTAADTSGYVASLDTVHNGDTVSVSYQHPRAVFALNIRRRPDTARVVTMPTVIVERDPWWYDVAKIGGGLVAGYLIGRAR